MNLMYKTVKSTVKPNAVEIQKTTVYLRKDISKATRTDESGKVLEYWTYQEATMTHDEFNAYSSQMAAINAVKGIYDSENISLIVANGDDSNNNQLILMEAIADLYDVIASMM